MEREVLMPLPLIVHRISKRFVAGIPGCSASVLALQRASLVVRSTEVVALVGPPGSGKSTLLLCAAGLLRPDSGAVWWFERYHDVSSCSGLVRFVRHGPETPRMIGLAMERGARLIVIDAVEAKDQDALARSIGAIARLGGSALLAVPDRGMAIALGARTVDLVSGRTDISDEGSPRRQPARVAEDPQFSVDPPMGWV